MANRHRDPSSQSDCGEFTGEVFSRAADHRCSFAIAESAAVRLGERGLPFLAREVPSAAAREGRSRIGIRSVLPRHRPDLADMQVIVRLDHLHDQALCEPEGRGDLSITHIMPRIDRVVGHARVPHLAAATSRRPPKTPGAAPLQR
jgi:hypothetical protein